MKYKRVRNPDVIDARGAGPRRRGGAALPVGGGLGVVGVLIVLAIQVLGGGSGGFDIPSGLGEGARAPVSSDPIPADQDPERDLKDFSTYVFTDAQQTWQRTFADAGDRYERAQMVLYRGETDTGCGPGSATIGPFYCPADQRVYIDLSFFGELQDRLGAPGDFAWAYVIAHEVGHHVQNRLGTSDDVRRLQRESPDDANELSVRLELQADCYAGVWAASAFEDIEPGDIAEGFAAAEAVGDDRLQRRATGRVSPESFTHGTSEQRRRWFDRGRQGGRPQDCDTFGADEV